MDRQVDDKQTVEWTERWRDRQTDGWTGGQTGSLADCQMNEHTDTHTEWTGGQTDRREERQLNRQKGGQTARFMDGWTDRQSGRLHDRRQVVQCWYDDRHTGRQIKKQKEGHTD
jgi:hypothetical protein